MSEELLDVLGMFFIGLALVALYKRVGILETEIKKKSVEIKNPQWLKVKDKRDENE